MIKHFENKEAITKLQELLNEVKVCMFATCDEEHNVFSRPMWTADVDDNGDVWFFTNEYSEKVQDVSKDNKVYLIYSHPGKNTYVHVQGVCSVTEDQQKINQLWNPSVKAWFPEGRDDRRLCLLRVNTLHASYWDPSSSKLLTFFNLLKSATGSKPMSGETGDLKL